MKLKRLLIVNMAIVAGMLALSIWAWGELPPDSKIPVHFDLAGVPDEYMGKGWGLLLLPLLNLLITSIELIIPKIEPYQQNLQRSSKAYTAVAVASAVFISGIHLVIILSALGKTIDVTAFISITMGLLFIILGNYLSKIRRNYLFGLRTPWTLSSDLAWHKTHRLASWLTVLHGFAFLISGLLSNGTLLNYAVISLLIVSLVVLPIYSYLLWKSDNNRSIS